MKRLIPKYKYGSILKYQEGGTSWFDTLKDVGSRWIASKQQVTKSPNVLKVDDTRLLYEWMMAIENPDKKGWNGKVWTKIKDPNGKDRDVGPGLKIGSAIADKPSYTEDEIYEAFKKSYNEKLNQVKNVYSQTYNNWDKIDPKLKFLMVNTTYQSGNTNFPKMYEYVNNGNVLGALFESRCKFGLDGSKQYDNARIQRYIDLLYPNLYRVESNGQTFNYKVIDLTNNKFLQNY